MKALDIVLKICLNDSPRREEVILSNTSALTTRPVYTTPLYQYLKNNLICKKSSKLKGGNYV